jgi:hypothetical protein
MAKLRKTENAEDIFTVTVESSVDMTTFAKSYGVDKPETDVLTQILVHAKENHWYINQYDTKDELMGQLEKHLTEEELLEISDMELVEEQIDDLTSELNWIAAHGIEYLTITKFGEKYELDVTKDDIRKIFLDMIK